MNEVNDSGWFRRIAAEQSEGALPIIEEELS